jgi:Ser/Thr protein kinase RdoA (MazF antagonist)
MTGRSQPLYLPARRAQIGCLHRLAVSALAGYHLEQPRLRFLRSRWNTFFAVHTADGARYVLRIGHPTARTLLDVRSELAWLQALQRDTDLSTVVPIPGRDGSLVYTVHDRGLPEPRHCVLFAWVPGRSIPRPPSTGVVRRLGGVMAALHDHADRFLPPAPFTGESLRTAWTFGYPDPIYSARPHPLLSEEEKVLLRRVAARGQRLLDRLYVVPSGLRFIHADLHVGNVKQGRGVLHVLDFDDCCWGFPVQDISIALFALTRFPNGDALREAFLQGYADGRPLPRGQEDLDLLIAVRAADLASFFVTDPDLGDAERRRAGIELCLAALRRVDGGE